MYQYDNNLLPAAFSFYFSSLLSSKVTRSNRVYTSIFARTNTRKFSIKYQGPSVWNSLPVVVRAATGLAHFKHQVRAHAIENVM